MYETLSRNNVLERALKALADAHSTDLGAAQFEPDEQEVILDYAGSDSELELDGDGGEPPVDLAQRKTYLRTPDELSLSHQLEGALRPVSETTRCLEGDSVSPDT